MKNLLLCAALCFLAGLISVGCTNSKKSGTVNDSDSVSATVTPEQLANPNQQGGEHSVFGVTLDRAMNSIVIITEKGDTMNFGYPNVEDRHSFASSNIGDSVTVKYVVVNHQDSVTAIMRGKHL